MKERERYRRHIHAHVVEAKTNFVPNRVHGASPPDILPLESLLPRSVHTTLAQLHSGHYWLLNSYKACITRGISDVCPECGVAPHSIEHLFNCQSHPTQLTVGQSGHSCSCRLPQPGQLMIRDELLGYHNNDKRYCKRDIGNIRTLTSAATKNRMTWPSL